MAANHRHINSRCNRFHRNARVGWIRCGSDIRVRVCGANGSHYGKRNGRVCFVDGGFILFLFTYLLNMHGLIVGRLHYEDGREIGCTLANVIVC